MSDRPLTEQIEQVKGSLARLPGQLAEARRALADRRHDVEAAAASVKDLENEHLSIVSAETNDAGKPAFSNKESREAEVRTRLRANAAYQQGKRRLDEAETAKLNAEMRLNQLQDEERALDRTLDAVGHQVRAESIRELTKSVIELTALEAKRMAGMGTR
jgi:hypothetical protein